MDVKVFVDGPKNKLERCIEFLEMLPIPLFPSEEDVFKIGAKVPCVRSTVYRARDELKLRHRLRFFETDVQDPKYHELKAITLRSVNVELKQLLEDLYVIMLQYMENDRINAATKQGITTEKVRPLDKIQKQRVELIQRYLGRYTEPEK